MSDLASDNFFLIWIAFQGPSICCSQCRWASQPPTKDDRGGIEQVTLTKLIGDANDHTENFHSEAIG